MKRILTFLVIALAIFVNIPIVAMAQESEESAEKTTQIRDFSENAKNRAENLSKKKEELRLEIQGKVEARKAQIRKDVCENSQERLNKLLPKLSNGANTVKTQIDKHYDRVQGFYERGQLTVANYQELVDAIELAKANAENSLEALNSYEFTVDCESTTVAGQLDAYREAVKEARESLKAYRKTVVDLISALKSANASANQTTTTEVNNSGEASQ